MKNIKIMSDSGYGKAAGVGGAIGTAGTIGFVAGALGSAPLLPVILPAAAIVGAGTAIGAGIGSFVKFLLD